ncbi:hypothetical protein DXG01_012870 [Tephrocybe rancida]|nr:hypothetical protein DXG01_012870 [Tephrocybe rancida]
MISESLVDPHPEVEGEEDEKELLTGWARGLPRMDSEDTGGKEKEREGASTIGGATPSQAQYQEELGEASVWDNQLWTKLLLQSMLGVVSSGTTATNTSKTLNLHPTTSS